jgi:LuxR family quorum sensing-dependent transcriptional regulator
MLTSHRMLLCDTIDEIAGLTSLSEVSSKFAHAVAKLGFSAFGVNGLPPATGQADPVILTESTPPGFRELYTQERFYAVDHIGAHARISWKPFRYDEAPYAATGSERHRRFLQALTSYRIGRGLIVPIGYTTSIPACVWLGGEDPELHDDARVAAQSISLFAASKARMLFCEPRSAGSRQLSTREREVLQWTCVGKTASEVAEILGIAKRTVDGHVRSAAVKLGAVNRTQAVALALCQKQISL